MGRTVFGVQDGNGDYRQAFVQLSCATISQILNSLNPQLLQLINNLNLLSLLGNAGLCPGQAKTLNTAYARYQQQHGNPTGSGSNPLANLSLAQSALSVLAQGSAAKNLAALGLQNLNLSHLFLPKLPTH